MSNENLKTCQRISEELDQLSQGELFTCPICGETKVLRKEFENESGETVYIFSCGCESEEEGEEFTFFDYLENVLDIEYTCNSKKEYTGCKLCIACGGPNIYINTNTGSVQLFWWSEKAEYEMSTTTVDYIDQYMEESFYWI